MIHYRSHDSEGTLQAFPRALQFHYRGPRKHGSSNPHAGDFNLASPEFAQAASDRMKTSITFGGFLSKLRDVDLRDKSIASREEEPSLFWAIQPQEDLSAITTLFPNPVSLPHCAPTSQTNHVAHWAANTCLQICPTMSSKCLRLWKRFLLQLPRIAARPAIVGL